MNLFHLNTGDDKKVLLNANYDIRRYTDFINKSIELLKRETLSIKVTKTVTINSFFLIGFHRLTFSPNK